MNYSKQKDSKNSLFKHQHAKKPVHQNELEQVERLKEHFVVKYRETCPSS